jgi:predicted metal-binding protein
METPAATDFCITLYVCAVCDRNPTVADTPAAEGRIFYQQVQAHFAGHEGIRVKSVKCLGGCECNGTPNGCCSVALTSHGRHTYVLNQLNPAADVWKLDEFLRLYNARPNGRIWCRDSVHAEALRPHIATRVPPPEDREE